MLESFAFVGLFAIVALIFPFLPLIIARFIAPRRPNSVKNDIYESGMRTIGPTWVQVRVQYYIYALIFVVFDVETVFLYPWAVVFRQVGLFALIEMFVFIAILVVGLAYAWRKDLLRWA